MSQVKSSDLTVKKNTDVDEDDIIANLEVLLNYDSLEQADSWEVLMEMADIGSIKEKDEQEDEGEN